MSEQKTHEEIIEEMRTKAECAKPYDDGIVMMLTDYADRLDAAHKREKATAEKSSAVGNAAAMREALLALKELDFNKEEDCYAFYRIIDEVLAKPPRNCDIGTPEEQCKRFKNFCRTHQFISADSEYGFPPMHVCSNESCPLHDYYIAHGEDNCELEWGQMPYEEGVEK